MILSTHNQSSIAHITLNSGDLAMVPRSYLTDHARLTEIFKSLVAVGGGAIPSVPYIEFIIVDHPEGAATISVNVNSMECVVATLCYDPSSSDKWWNKLRNIYQQAVAVGIAFGLADVALRPPRTPWLGVALFNTVTALDPETQGLLAAIEENIAIACLELRPV